MGDRALANAQLSEYLTRHDRYCLVCGAFAASGNYVCSEHKRRDTCIVCENIAFPHATKCSECLPDNVYLEKLLHGLSVVSTIIVAARGRKVQCCVCSRPSYRNLNHCKPCLAQKLMQQM